MLFNSNITTVGVKKNEKEYHITESNKNGWKVSKIEEHNTDRNLLLITYIKE